MKSSIKLKGSVIIGSVLLITNIYSYNKLKNYDKEVETLKSEIIKVENNSNKTISKFKEDIENLKIEISKKEILNESQNSEIENLKKEILKKEILKKEKKSTRNISKSRVFQATAYCKCIKCCGKWSNSPTKSGTKPKEGRTIAVDPNIIPLGSRVLVNGKEYIAEDTGSAIKGRIIDIYFNDHNSALKFGRQKVNVEVIK